MVRLAVSLSRASIFLMCFLEMNLITNIDTGSEVNVNTTYNLINYIPFAGARRKSEGRGFESR
jgi:hypothetical protein